MPGSGLSLKVMAGAGGLEQLLKAREQKMLVVVLAAGLVQSLTGVHDAPPRAALYFCHNPC
jgi:hypothetical protein